MALNTLYTHTLYTHVTSTQTRKFQSFSLYGHPSSSYIPFWDKCTQWPPKWRWTLIGQRYPIYMLQLPPSPKIRSVLLYGQPFWVTGHFETSAPNDIKMTLNTKRSKMPHIIYNNYSRVPDFTPFRFMISHFLRYWQFFIIPLSTILNSNLLF